MPAPVDDDTTLPTRMCSHCGVRTAQFTRITRPRESGVRNYFFCPECCPTQITTCGYCNTLVLSRDVGYSARLPDGQSRSHVCNTCVARLQVRCAGCAMVLQFCFAPTDTVVVMHCADCQNTTCPRCNRPRIGRWVVNSFAPGTAGNSVCTGCRFLPIHADTFNANPSGRLVGFELEFLNPAAIQAMPELALLGNIHGDGSVHTLNEECIETINGREFASRPMNGDVLWNNIGHVMRTITDNYRGYVNNTCGLHVHLDVSTMSVAAVKNLVRWWTLFEPMFFSLVPINRRNNRYTQAVGWKSEALSADRYRAMNYAAYAEHGSLEVRLHHATLDPDEFRFWLQLLLALFDTFSGLTITPNMYTLSMRGLTSYFMAETKLPWRSRKMLVKRIRQHGWAPEYLLQPTPSNPAPASASAAAAATRQLSSDAYAGWVQPTTWRILAPLTTTTA